MGRTCVVAESAEAFRVDYEITDVERARLDPSYRQRRARMVMVRTGSNYTPGRNDWTKSDTHVAKEAEYPVLLFLVYANRPEDFNAGLPDFERFTQDIGLGAQGAEPPGQPSGLTCSALKRLVSAKPAFSPEPPPAAPPVTSAPPPASETPADSAPPAGSAARAN